KYLFLPARVQAAVHHRSPPAWNAAPHNGNPLRKPVISVYSYKVRQLSDVRRTPQHVHTSASCGTGKTASGPGSGNCRSPGPSIDRRSRDRRIETSQVAGEG